MELKDVQEELQNLTIAMAEKYWPRGFNYSNEPKDSYSVMLREYMRTGLITVWIGASEKTIFGIPKINWDFRAWHDYWHIKLNADFSYENELRVMRRQQLDCYQWCRDNGINADKTRFLLLLLEAEIKGQADYELEHGEFPVDQVKFAERYVIMTERMLLEESTTKPITKNALRP